MSDEYQARLRARQTAEREQKERIARVKSEDGSKILANIEKLHLIDDQDIANVALDLVATKLADRKSSYDRLEPDEQWRWVDEALTQATKQKPVRGEEELAPKPINEAEDANTKRENRVAALDERLLLYRRPVDRKPGHYAALKTEAVRAGVDDHTLGGDAQDSEKNKEKKALLTRQANETTAKQQMRSEDINTPAKPAEARLTLDTAKERESRLYIGVKSKDAGNSRDGGSRTQGGTGRGGRGRGR